MAKEILNHTNIFYKYILIYIQFRLDLDTVNFLKINVNNKKYMEDLVVCVFHYKFTIHQNIYYLENVYIHDIWTQNPKCL